jgi:c-di-GMP-binding flagellar brake protein YcgR
MQEELKVNRRKWSRETVRIPVQYFIKGESTRYKEGTIVNISRSGAGVLFPLNEPLPIGAQVFLELFVPKSLEQLSLKGEVKTRHKRGDSLIGGIHFIALLPEDLFSKLS